MMASTEKEQQSRPLKSCEPDLVILVGLEEQVFHCYSVIMASYSDYIAAMLSTPMKEQDTMKITFPDIEPEIWKKMIRFLEPGGSRYLGMDDYLELSPFYDKYSFKAAVAECDEIFSNYFDVVGGGLSSPRTKIVPVAELCYQYNLPLSKKRPSSTQR